MKIIIIGTIASSLVSFRSALIKELISRGDDVFAFAVDYTDETRKAICNLGAKPVDYTISRTGINPLSDLIQMFKLSVTIHKIKPDVCFCYFAKPVIFGSVAALIAGVRKRFGMIEGLGYGFTRRPQEKNMKGMVVSRVQTFLYKMVIPHLSGVVFLNNDDVKDLVVRNSIKSNSLSVLGGIGVNLNEYQYVRPTASTIRFIFIGRLLKEKGINEYLDAAEKVKSIYKNVEFIVLGGVDSGHPGSISRTRIDSLVKSGIITYPGVVKNVRDWIEKSSVFVLPSYREGYPRSTQEAMAVGRAVITTSVPGCKETVIDGVNGFLIPPYSSNALVHKMIFFINHQTAIVDMGLKSREMAIKQYDEKKVNRKIVEMIAE